jgi:hypothetical protein
MAVWLWTAGGTLDALGLQPLQVVSHDQRVPLAVLTRDIQFRGAISDFHAHRALIKAADCDPLVLRSNPDDTYGDGNNFEARPRSHTDQSLRTANMEMLHLTCSLHKALSRAAGGNKGCRRPVGCCSRRGSFAAAGQGRGGCGGGPRTRRAATQASHAAAQALDVPGAHPGVDGPACAQASGCKRQRRDECPETLAHSPTLGWLLQGSDEEVRAGAACEPCSRTRVRAQRARRHFGRPCSFADLPAEALWDSPSMQGLSPVDLGPLVQRREVDAAVQACPGATDWPTCPCVCLVAQP